MRSTHGQRVNSANNAILLLLTGELFNHGHSINRNIGATTFCQLATSSNHPKLG